MNRFPQINFETGNPDRDLIFARKQSSAVYSPVPAVVRADFVPVFDSVTTTDAPATGEPVASVTMPAIVPRYSCAKRTVGAVRKKKGITQTWRFHGQYLLMEKKRMA